MYQLNNDIIVTILRGSRPPGSGGFRRVMSNSQASAIRVEHVEFTDDTCIRYEIIDRFKDTPND